MARIIGAIATSHTPTIGFAKDRRLENDPIWKPIFDAYAQTAAYLQSQWFYSNGNQIYAGLRAERDAVHDRV